MDLPIGLQTQLEESERRLQALLAGMGLDRAGLARVARRMRASMPLSRASAPRPAAVRAGTGPAGRRGIHV